MMSVRKVQLLLLWLWLSLSFQQPSSILSTCFTALPMRVGRPSSSRSHTSAAAEAAQQREAAPSGTLLGAPICEYHQITVPTTQPGPPRQAVSVEDLTGTLEELLRESGMQCGTVTVLSRHTTTALTINERESRLARDTAAFLLRLAPPDERSQVGTANGVRYQHNDMDQRPESADEAARCRANGWNIDVEETLQAWRAQEPINAHSHLLSMLLGSSESIPVHDGRMVLGDWQSVLLVDLDGPRDRTVGVQLMGYCQASRASKPQESSHANVLLNARRGNCRLQGTRAEYARNKSTVAKNASTKRKRHVNWVGWKRNIVLLTLLLILDYYFSLRHRV